jgi:hypothetical protein
MNKELINKIIGNPTKIENLEVVQFDFPDKMNWTDAPAKAEER